MVRTTLLVGMVLAAAGAARADDVGIGRVVLARGSVEIRHAHAGATQDVPLAAGAELHATDVVHTGAGGTARILMHDKSILELGERSRISLANYRTAAAPERTVKLWIGKLWARVSKSVSGDRDFEVATPNAVAGVRGTRLIVGVAASGTQVTVEDGTVEVSDTSGAKLQMLNAFEQLTVGSNGATSTATLTPAQLASLNGSFSSGGGSSEGAQQRLSGAAQNLGMDESAVEAATSGSVTPGGTPPPTLDLDPGAPPAPQDGKAHVRGHIKLEE